MGKKKALILGCGWVGKITADLLLENKVEIWGTTTQKEKIEELPGTGIHPILLDLFNEDDIEQACIDLASQTFDLILISIPVKRNEDTQKCLRKFENLIELLTKITYKQIIYLSSIGIYEPINGTITEESAVKEKENIFLVQHYLKQQIPNLTILRLGGLFGFGRIPGRYFSNKTCAVGQEKANYVHGTDVARSIFQIWKMGISNRIYNIVAPSHPLKKDIYTVMAKKYNFPPPSLYIEETVFQKEVSSEKLIQEVGFKFAISSPLKF
jgi:nucleoside-diphosphate-sugar epimerase